MFAREWFGRTVQFSLRFESFFGVKNCWVLFGLSSWFRSYTEFQVSWVTVISFIQFYSCMDIIIKGENKDDQ